MRVGLEHSSCLAAVLGVACSVGEPAIAPKLEVYRHHAWSEIAPKGFEAEGVRRNLAVGDAVTFRELEVSVSEVRAATIEGGSDRVEFELTRGSISEPRIATEGEAFHWEGFRVAVVAIYTQRGELGFGSTVVEIAAVASLPEAIASSTRAGGAESRLRIPHRIQKLTLHHSATRLTPVDDLGTKLRNMQVWGERDRNWFDVPYHFIVGLDGSILEARDWRYVGDTNTRYDPTGHFLVNCYGNYNAQHPNELQLDAIARLFAWAALEFGIDPPEVLGHRDLAQTSCPGDHLYAYLESGEIERRVVEAMRAGKPELVWRDRMPAPRSR